MHTNTSFHYRPTKDDPWKCLTYNINWHRAQAFCVAMHGEGTAHGTCPDTGDRYVHYTCPDGIELKIINHTISLMEAPQL